VKILKGNDKDKTDISPISFAKEQNVLLA